LTSGRILHLLSRLAFLLRDPGFLPLIQSEGPAEEIIAAAHRIESSLP